MEDTIYFLILIAIFIFPIYLVYKNRKKPYTRNENMEHHLDEMIAKVGTKYTDGLVSKMYGYNETKFEEIRQWTAAYGDEEARKMYKEKYCNDKKQENNTTRG